MEINDLSQFHPVAPIVSPVGWKPLATFVFPQTLKEHRLTNIQYHIKLVLQI